MKTLTHTEQRVAEQWATDAYDYRQTLACSIMEYNACVVSTARVPLIASEAMRLLILWRATDKAVRS